MELCSGFCCSDVPVWQGFRYFLQSTAIGSSHTSPSFSLWQSTYVLFEVRSWGTGTISYALWWPFPWTNILPSPEIMLSVEINVMSCVPTSSKYPVYLGRPWGGSYAVGQAALHPVRPSLSKTSERSIVETWEFFAAVDTSTDMA